MNLSRAIVPCGCDYSDLGAAVELDLVHDPPVKDNSCSDLRNVTVNVVWYSSYGFTQV